MAQSPEVDGQPLPSAAAPIIALDGVSKEFEGKRNTWLRPIAP